MSTAAPTTMKIVREDVNPCTVKLTVTCTPEQVDAGFAKAVKAIGKKIKVPGFRPGQAPRKLVEDMANPETLFQEAADEIVRVAYADALKQYELVPHSQPSIELTKLDKTSKECEFTAKIPLAPKIELGDYSKLKVEKTKATVSEEEVEAQIEQLRKKEGKKQEIKDRGIASGDAAVVNIKLEGEEGEGRTFMVMAGQTFPDLDAAIEGLKAEEIKGAELTFPENFQEKDWAGQKRHVTLTIRSISSIELPELDDEFAKSYNLDNVDDLKQRVKDGIKAAKDEMAQEMVNEKLLDQLVAASTIHVAENTWETVADRRLREIAGELSNRGSTLQAYAEQNGMTIDQLVEAQKEEARLHVRRAVVIERIFTAEGMKVTDTEAAHHFAALAREYQVPPEQVQKFLKEYGPQVRDEVIFRAMHGKVMGLLNEKAEITEVEAGSESGQKPASRTKSKSKK